MAKKVGDQFYEASGTFIGSDDTFIRDHDWFDEDGNYAYTKELYDPADGGSRKSQCLVLYRGSVSDVSIGLADGSIKKHPHRPGIYVEKKSAEGITKVIRHFDEVMEALKQGKWLLFFEGEKDADKFRELDARNEFAATTSPWGATSWNPSVIAPLLPFKPRVAIFADNDEAGHSYADRIAKAFYGHAAEIKVVFLYKMEGSDEEEIKSHPNYKKDFSDWVEEAFGEDKELGIKALSSEDVISEVKAQINIATNYKPTYRTNVTVEGDVAEEVAGLLGAKRSVFRYAGMPVITTRGETGARFKEADGSLTYEKVLTFKPTNEPTIKNAIEKVSNWEGPRGGNGEITSKKVPDWVVKNVGQAQVGVLPYLAGFVRHPLLSDSGIVSRSDGYDEKLKLYWDSKDLEIVEFKGTPREALEFYCLKTLSGFPYKTEQDMYRAVAFPATLLTRKTKIHDGQSPCFMFAASEAHSYKTLNVEMQFRIVTGRRIGMRPYPTSEDEIHKSFTAGICSDPEAMFYDNVRNGTSFGNPLIEMFLTSGRATIRPFGQNIAEREVSSSALIVASQNRPSFETGDMYTRTCMASLERNGPVDEAWIDEAVRASKEDRGVLLGALAKVLEAEPAENIHRCRFKDWWSAVGGRICAAAGDFDIFKSLSDPSDVPSPEADAIRDLAIEMFAFLSSPQTGPQGDMQKEIEKRRMFTWADLLEISGELMEDVILALTRKSELSGGLNNNHSKVLSKANSTKVKMPDGQLCRFRTGRFKDVKQRPKNGYFLEFVDGPENVAM